MEIKFDYNEVPFSFGHCAVSTCPKRETCLRFIAWQQAPTSRPFLSLINVRYLEARGNKCDMYLSNAPVRYARGFIHLTKVLPVAAADRFRYRMIGQFGRKVYYQMRKGERLIHPDEQQLIVSLVKSLGVEIADCFDAYEEAYDWKG